MFLQAASWNRLFKYIDVCSNMDDMYVYKYFQFTLVHLILHLSVNLMDSQHLV